MVYFFAGRKRKGDLKECMLEVFTPLGITLIVDEVDLLLGGQDHDLSDIDKQSEFLSKLGSYTFIVITPPCLTHSRAPWTNSYGPHPIRSALYPAGFPWLSNKDKQKAELHNNLVSFTWAILSKVQLLSATQLVFALAEHPEDLGRLINKSPTHVPASIWRMKELQGLIYNNWWCGGVRQCDYDAPTPKPTRFISNSWQFEDISKHALPTFDDKGFYSGPILKCNHSGHVSLLRKRGDTGPFRTEQAAAYPPKLCMAIANSFKSAYLIASTPLVGELKQTCNTTAKENTSFEVQKDSNKLIEGIDYIKAGWWGAGDPIKTSTAPGRFGRDFRDGAGLCSPGRWPFEQRILPSQGSQITDMMDAWLLEESHSSGIPLEKMCLSMMVSQLEFDPWLTKTHLFRASMSNWLAQMGYSKLPMVWKPGQVIDFSLMHALAKFLEDPDSDTLLEFINDGTRIGIDCELPRSPAVWPLKKKWPLGPFSEIDLSELNPNYPSARDRPEDLRKEVQDQIDRGWLLETTLGEAQQKYGTVTVAALALIEEAPGKLRVLHDGTNLVQLNHRIHVRDSEQYPTALDVQAAVIGDPSLKTPIVSTVTDAEKAHRRVPIDPKDWGHLGCAIDPMPTNPADRQNWKILLNTVGTYGISCASIQWARVASLIQRLAYYVCRPNFLFRFADDFLILSSNKEWSQDRPPEKYYMAILRFFLLCNLVSFPIKWKKTHGGFSCDFVGNQFNWLKLEGGLSEKRSLWLVNWANKTADAGIVESRELRASLGRFSFSTTLLRYMLPFLGPFYAWLATLPDGAARPLPLALIVLLRWLAQKITASPKVPLRPICTYSDTVYWTDAKAEGMTVVVAGYERTSIGADTRSCRWFAYTLTPQNAAWAFIKEKQAFRVIAALELYASLLCLLLFLPQEQQSATMGIVLTGMTDNKSNTSLVAKAMSSKFPLYIVLIEFTEQLLAKGVSLELKWTPREHNQDADDLTNSKQDNFSQDLRIDTPLEELPWKVLPELMRTATDLYKDIKSSKEQKLLDTPHKLRKTRPQEKLKRKDPW